MDERNANIVLKIIAGFSLLKGIGYTYLIYLFYSVNFASKIILYILSLQIIVSSIGLFYRKSWGKHGIVSLSTLEILFALIAIIQDYEYTKLLFLSIVISISIIIFILTNLKIPPSSNINKPLSEEDKKIENKKIIHRGFVVLSIFLLIPLSLLSFFFERSSGISDWVMFVFNFITLVSLVALFRFLISFSSYPLVRLFQIWSTSNLLFTLIYMIVSYFSIHFMQMNNWLDEYASLGVIWIPFLMGIFSVFSLVSILIVRKVLSNNSKRITLNTNSFVPSQ